MAANNFYRTPHLTTISFAVGILLFFLPFMEIKCNGTTLAQMSGLNMVTGAEPKVGGDLDKMSKALNDGATPTTKTETKTDKKGKVYLLAIAALALGVIGLIVAITKKGVYNKTEMIIGVVGAVALLALMFHVKSDVNKMMQDGKKDEISTVMNLTAEFTFWFYLCVLSYLSAAFFSYKQKELIGDTDVPPVSAPQLNIQNPGDQSDFPASASGGKDLG